MVKPVLRYPGSKYRKIPDIIKILAIQKNDVFVDLFAGSGIVGVNVRHLIGCDVIINDYDQIFPLTISTTIKNMVSFQGIGKSFTKAALKYFNTRVVNGYWTKWDHYNTILKQCMIIKKDYALTLQDILKTSKSHTSYKIYLDPPYVNIKHLYQNSNIDHHMLKKHLMAFLKIHPYTQFCISYNDVPLIRTIYQDWTINTLEFRYSTGKIANYCHKPKVQELIITNF